MGSEWVQKKIFNLYIVQISTKKIKFFQTLPYAIYWSFKIPNCKKLNILIKFFRFFGNLCKHELNLIISTCHLIRFIYFKKEYKRNKYCITDLNNSFSFDYSCNFYTSCFFILMIVPKFWSFLSIIYCWLL